MIATLFWLMSVSCASSLAGQYFVVDKQGHVYGDLTKQQAKDLSKKVGGRFYLDHQIVLEDPPTKKEGRSGDKYRFPPRDPRLPIDDGTGRMLIGQAADDAINRDQVINDEPSRIVLWFLLELLAAVRMTV